jgi:RNA polymerase sigma factor (sigma-70 family)
MSDKRSRFVHETLPHFDAAYNLARWLARSASDADDIVQEALLLAFRGFDGKRGENTKAWLLAIVRNTFLSARRREGARPRATDSLDGEHSSTPPALVSTDDPERHAILADEARTLDDALAALPPDYREILVLREVEGLSYREISVVIEAPVGTVMSRLARARDALRSHWLVSAGETDHAVP